MVGPIMLMKILHCKRLRKRKPSKIENNLQETSHTIIHENNIKKEQSESGSQTCRVCLKEGDISLYGNENAENLTEALTIFGGIEVNIDDEYPKFICKSCHSLLKGAILLRKTAQQSDQLLRQPPLYTTLTDNEEDINTAEDNSDDDHEEEQLKKHDYHCKKCDLNFETFKEYSDHRLSPEHENMRHRCPFCNNTYSSLYFKKHLALHKLETAYMCDVCGKKFIMQGQFTRHRLTHFYELPFQCSLCPYKGRFSESLKMHMRTHTGEKPYQCNLCPSRFFVNKSNLNKHMLTHKTDYDFKCESCGRGFYTKRSLEQHFKVDHTGIKDHVCNMCGKAFGYRKQMMKHQLKVHKRDKLRSGRMPLYLQLETKKQKEIDC